MLNWITNDILSFIICLIIARTIIPPILFIGANRDYAMGRMVHYLDFSFSTLSPTMFWD